MLLSNKYYKRKFLLKHYFSIYIYCTVITISKQTMDYESPRHIYQFSERRHLEIKDKLCPMTPPIFKNYAPCP